MLILLGQLLGICGSAATILSYQTKKPKLYCLLQATSGSFFTVSFLILGAPTSALLNGLNIARGGILAAGKKFRKLPVLIGILLANLLATVGTLVWQYHSPIPGRENQFTAVLIFGICTLIAQIVSTFAMWSDDGRVIRGLQFFLVSPLWLANNIYFFSVGGLICEGFTLVSILLSILRFGWKGLARGAAGTGTEAEK